MLRPQSRVWRSCVNGLLLGVGIALIHVFGILLELHRGASLTQATAGLSDLAILTSLPLGITLGPAVSAILMGASGENRGTLFTVVASLLAMHAINWAVLGLLVGAVREWLSRPVD